MSASKKCSLSLIVCMAENHVIGNQNKMPWNLPQDLQRFKKLTLGHPILMGRKTHESIGRVLPGRENIVISRNSEFKSEGVRVFSSLEQGLDFLKKTTREAFVIGGAEIYRLALPLVDKIYLTIIHQPFEGDAFFPDIPKENFKLVSQEDFTEPYSFSFLDYERTPF